MAALNITFYQRTLLGTSANQKRYYLKSYNNIHYAIDQQHKMYKQYLLYHGTKAQNEQIIEVNIIFQTFSRHLKIEMVFPN
jgi:hypothetical protein